jgi:type III pantothenate kinase
MPERILTVDVGNTSIKLGEFTLQPAADAAGPTRQLRVSSTAMDWDRLHDWLKPEPMALYLASVCQPATDRLVDWVQRYRPEYAVRQLQPADFPLSVKVEMPQRVGLDRLAAAVAANYLKAENRAAIVVDAGSAITVDLVSPAGDFLGGAIFPGWQLMARSLANNTYLLPEIAGPDDVAPPDVIGRSTERAILSGLYWGSIGAVRELIVRMSRCWDPAPERILGGGDTNMLLPYLGDDVRSIPDIVLRGIFYTVASMPDVAAGQSAE